MQAVPEQSLCSISEKKKRNVFHRMSVSNKHSQLPTYHLVSASKTFQRASCAKV